MLWLVVVALLAALIAGFVVAYNRLQRLSVKVEEAGSDIDVALEKRYDLLSEQLAAVKKYLSHEHETLTGVTGLRSGTAGENRRLNQQEALSAETVRTIDRELDRQSQQMAQIRRQLDRGDLRRVRGRRGREQLQQRRAQTQAQLDQASGQRGDTLGQKIGALATAHRDLAGVSAGIDALCEQYPLLNSWISMDQFQRAVFNSEEHLQAARRLYNANVSLYNQTVRTLPWAVVASLCHLEPAAFYEVEEQKRSFQANFD